MFEKVFSRVKLLFPDNKIQIYYDGNDDYKTTIPKYYAETCVDYGQVIKIRKGGKVADKIKIIVYGSPSIDEIEITYIENMLVLMFSVVSSDNLPSMQKSIDYVTNYHYRRSH